MIAPSNVFPLLRKSSILDDGGRPFAVPVPSPLDGNRLSRLARTGIDAAAVGNRHNEAHFADADGRPLSSILSDHLDVTRKRLRYETINNGDAKGIVETLANMVVGVGPILSANTGDADLDQAVEEEFAIFADDCSFETPEVSLGDLLQADIREQCVAGEDFWTYTTDDRYDGPVKLRLQPIAAERIATPMDRLTDAAIIDGIEFDSRRRPVRYHVAACHPRDSAPHAWRLYGKSEAVDVTQCRHNFIAVEPGQHRGLPWMSSTLENLAAMRRCALAVLSAAETAADISFVLKSTLPTFDEPARIAAMDVIQMARNAGITLPAGWDIQQFEARQPTASHESFMRDRLRAAGRAVHMPYNISAADSRQMNFASGRLDGQLFFLFVNTLRAWKIRRKVRWIYRLWLAEARLAIPRLRPLTGRDLRHLAHWATFNFRTPSMHGDPVKEMVAISEGLRNGAMTYVDVCADRGLDWETQLEKGHKVNIKRLELAAALKKIARDLELTDTEAAAALAPVQTEKLAATLATVQQAGDEDDTDVTGASDAEAA